jgi:hypothetical protein
MSRRWEQEALRRGARWFGIACACLPVLDVVDDYSVVDGALAGLATASWPAVPLRAWAMLAWVGGAGVAATRLMAWVAPASRMRLLGVCALMHSGYALASGPRPAVLVAMACFSYAFVVLQGARETWPEGHPGAPT